MELYYFGFVVAVVVIAVVVVWKIRSQLNALKIELAVAEQSERRLGGRVSELETERGELLVNKTSAETKLSSVEEQLQKIVAENKRYLQEKDDAVAAKGISLRDMELAKQRVETIEKEMEAWKKTKEQHIEIAKASVLEVGTKLSSKLLDDHKREVEAAKKENEKTVQATTKELHGKFQNVFESMTMLHEKVKQSGDTVEVVRRSLLNPVGAGSLAEITLENIFKASGLIENQDYRMQYWVTDQAGRGLKPDAVVFLPGNNVMVVDSKASKYFVEIGEAANDEIKSKELTDSLKKTMNNHLKDLVDRDYRKAVEGQISDANATTLMFLPTEASLESLRRVDPKFIDKAWKERIIPVGPSGLVTMLMNATMLISNAKQEENSKAILNEVRELLNSIAKLHGIANSMGRSLKSTLKQFDSFAGSFNRNFLSKAKKIEALGANMPKIKEVENIERFKIDNREYKEIEGNVEEG